MPANDIESVIKAQFGGGQTIDQGPAASIPSPPPGEPFTGGKMQMDPGGANYTPGRIGEMPNWMMHEKPIQGQVADIAKNALPIAGDIALTALAPSLMGEKLSIQALNALMRGAAAFGGGAGGELLAQKIGGEKTDLGKAALQGGIGAATETVLPAAAFVARKAARPTLELASNLTVSGRAILNRARDKIISDTTRRAEKFMGDLITPGTKAQSGMAIGEALAGKQDFKKVYEGYNKLIDAAAGPENEIILDGFSQRIGDQVQAQMAAQGDQNYATALNTVLKDLNLDAKSKRILNDMYKQSGYLDKNDVKYVLAKWNKNYRGNTAATNKLKDDLKATLLDDIGINSMTGTEAAEAKKTADQIFKESKQWFDANPAAQAALQKMRSSGGSYYEAFPEKTFDRIFSASPDELMRIKKEVTKAPGGTDAWAGAEFQFLRDMYEKAITIDKAAGEPRLLPYQLAQNIMENKEKIQKLMPDLWPKLKAEADYFMEVAPEFKKRAAADSVSGTMGQGLGPVVATYLAGGIQGIPVAETFGAISAYGLMSKPAQNAVKRLISGVTSTGTKTAIKTGLHLGAGNE
jgi:hypothetical protein